jgi:hypothetical protein
MLTVFLITNDGVLLGHAVSCHIVSTVISVVKLINASAWLIYISFDQTVVLSPSQSLSFVVTETLLGAPG